MLRTGDGYRRLLAVRFAVQWADGMFQAALGGAVLFNPEREADPLAVAAGLAVLLLPYSVIGPFAGALLDRWDRRRLLIFARLLRAALVAGRGRHRGRRAGRPTALHGRAAVAGISRFIERRAVGGAAARGAAPAPGGGQHAGRDDRRRGGRARRRHHDRAARDHRLGRCRLGDHHAGRGGRVGAGRGGGRRLPARVSSARTGTAGRAAAGGGPRFGFVDGARATLATPSVAASFLALAAHRLAFGISTLLTLLLFRYAFTDAGVLRVRAGRDRRGGGAGAAGLGLAALITPWMVHHLGRPRTIQAGAAGLHGRPAGAGRAAERPTVLVVAFVLGATGQISSCAPTPRCRARSPTSCSAGCSRSTTSCSTSAT